MENMTERIVTSKSNSDCFCSEPWMNTRHDIVFYGGFNSPAAQIPGGYAWKKKWGVPFFNRIGKVQIVSGDQALANGRSMRVCYPKGKFGPRFTGVQFPVSFEKIDSMPVKTFESLYIRYCVQFETGFDFRLGGKLPGMMGSAESWKRSGGDQPDGSNGWTLRLMWREGGRAVVYAYLPSHRYGGGRWGFDIDLNRTFQTGVWHCIEQFAKINDIGKENGKLDVWIDNEPVLSLQDVLYRTAATRAGDIGGIYVSTFHGGNSAEWAPLVDSYALFDGFAAAREERVGPYRPIT